MEPILCDMKTKLSGINIKWDLAEEAVNKHESIAIETIQNETHGEKENCQNEKSISELWDNFKQCNTHENGVSEGEGADKYLKE